MDPKFFNAITWYSQKIIGELNFIRFYLKNGPFISKNSLLLKYVNSITKTIKNNIYFVLFWRPFLFGETFIVFHGVQGTPFKKNIIKWKWNEHLNGKGGVISSLNQRLFLLRRLKGQLNKKSPKKVADSLFTSKIRYGLQLLGKVRVTEKDPKQNDMDSIQLIQNKLVRLLNNVKLSDRQTTRSLLKNIDLLSVNQLNSSIKLTDYGKLLIINNAH